jgi:Phosphotransferase enzyme family
MSYIPAPTTTDEVTTAWLDSVIEKKWPGVRIRDSKIDEVILGNSGKVRMSLTYNEVGERLRLPPRVIVKGGYNRFGPDFESVYFTEMRFYRDILPLLETNAPLCLYADRDEINQQSLVILEDLSLRDITWCHATRPLGYQEAADFLAAIALYNARWWQSPTLLPGGQLGWISETLDGWVGEYLQAYIQPELWRKYTALERGAALPRALHDRDRIERALLALKKIHKAAEFCLVHGDEHLGNLYIEPDGRPGFLDWQVKRAPWSQGVSYFMVGALDSADRRNWERGLLAHYLDCLAANGVAAPSFEKAWLSYRRDILYGFLVWVINDSKYQSETVNVANTVRFGTAMLDHDTLGLLV